MRKLILSLCVLLATSQAYAQGAYKILEQEINNWMMNLENELLIPTKPEKVFEHTQHQYIMIGHFNKGAAKNGSQIIINDLRNSIQLSGVVSYHMGETYVKGVKSVEGTSYTYGTFCISNTSTGFITNKTKQATALYIEDVDVVYTTTSSCIATKLTGNNKQTGDVVTLSVTSDGEFAKIWKEYRPGNTIISEELYVPSSLITADNVRDIKFYYQHANEISIEYEDGSTYQGKCRISVKDAMNEDGFTPVRTLTMGTYTYSNGDMFAGDMSGEKCAGIPVNGVMKFVDGSYKSGNWISEYQLSKKQMAVLDSYKTPSMIKKAAEMYAWSQKYTVYEDGILIEYFSPDNEKLSFINYDEVLYEKDTQWYLCKKWNYGKKKVVLKFKIDSYGRRVKEIVYNNDDYKPEYINHFELYSNGEVKTIRTYNYNSEKLYLVINCYSDGTLKSAYKYGTGNNGRNIIRLAKKEDNKNFFERFTTVQYDLDGNFERKVNWGIGEHSYTSNMINFTPEIVDIKSFKKAPLDNAYYDSQIVGNPKTLSEEDNELSQSNAILFNILTDNKEAVADRIFYPFQRQYPLPSIKNKEEMLQYYDIIFTDELKQHIVQNNEMHSIGWRGISICNGLMAGYNYEEGFIREQTIEERKANLHPSVQNFITPINIYRTKKFTIMIDKVSEEANGYRYACWRAGTDMKDTPSLVLYNGTVEAHGSMGLASFTFSNNVYKYVVDENGSLFVYKNGTLILEDDIISIE